MDLLVLIPAMVSLLFSLVATALLIRAYREYGYRAMARMTAGLAILTLPSAAYIPFEFLEGDKYLSWRHAAGLIATAASVLGIVTVYLATLDLSGKEVPTRVRFLEYWLILALGVTLISLETEWIDGGWVLNFCPFWTLLLLSIPMAWIATELLLIACVSMRHAAKEDHPVILLTAVSWSLSLFAMFVLPIERAMVRQHSVLYLTPVGTGLLLFSIAVAWNPQALIPRVIGGKSLIISEKASGKPIWMRQFGSPGHESFSSMMFAEGMKGILTMLGELSGRKTIPDRLGYSDYHILIEQTESFICYGVCLRDSQPVRVEIRRILQNLETEYSSQRRVASTLEELEKNVDDTLRFAL